MRPFVLATILMVGSTSVSAVTAAKADDVSWGCQVLLCAASKNPSWHSVPYCVAPMTRLIAAINDPAFSWPVCHEANAGKPGHDIFEDCPAGTTAGYSSQGDAGLRGEPNQCIKTVDLCRSPSQRGSNAAFKVTTVRRVFGNRGDSCIEQIATPRPRRNEPYFFDIPNDKGVKQRFWFDLDH
ncbi:MULTISPECIES: hypothetical protein [unclassified Rhizobium]|uniref:hypothetical protein n=2 Tax=Rhizobium TaxID=379 RepID=UPI0027DE8E4B|nr:MULTISPECIES: hypothetical protein [unclassified Rhizobium]